MGKPNFTNCAAILGGLAASRLAGWPPLVIKMAAVLRRYVYLAKTIFMGKTGYLGNAARLKKGRS